MKLKDRYVKHLPLGVQLPRASKCGLILLTVKLECQCGADIRTEHLRGELIEHPTGQGFIIKAVTYCARCSRFAVQKMHARPLPTGNWELIQAATYPVQYPWPEDANDYTVENAASDALGGWRQIIERVMAKSG